MNEDALSEWVNGKRQKDCSLCSDPGDHVVLLCEACAVTAYRTMHDYIALAAELPSPYFGENGDFPWRELIDVHAALAEIGAALEAWEDGDDGAKWDEALERVRLAMMRMLETLPARKAENVR